ncbi:MAG: tRNA (adenosine(37)-N6)-dimethylallyltransferase MiaA [Candidatus Zambryskibacteria bacterium]|nr:tRNA (adenosine(37)-N6)-dimethylallyltransferase MiaA [Candidatus Zambryskibacteria bacterium]
MANKVLVILGPTASGKSDLAVRLAKKFKGEVISADSRQVYRGLNIGTGKITKKEMQGVPHYLLDVANPKKQFSASDFVKKANEAIAMIYHSGHLPIVVGGTGFYIDALAGNIFLPDVPPNKKLRTKLSKKSNKALFKMLQKKDPRRAKTIDFNNKVRLIRALEIVKAIGKIPQLGSSTSKSIYSFIFIGLKPDNLKNRIEKRVKKMFKQGLLKEIIKLKKSGVSNKRLKELGFEYWNPTEESVIKNSIKYAKRQMTWFKRNKQIKWFTLSAIEGFKPEEYKKIEKYVRV